MARAGNLSLEDEISDRLEFEDELLEPQLVDLVDDDEQQFVMRRRIGQQTLGREDLGDLEVAAVGELPVLLTEARGPPAGAQLSPLESPFLPAESSESSDSGSSASLVAVVSWSTTLVEV